jgi:hypothetical protein
MPLRFDAAWSLQVWVRAHTRTGTGGHTADFAFRAADRKEDVPEPVTRCECLPWTLHVAKARYQVTASEKATVPNGTIGHRSFPSSGQWQLAPILDLQKVRLCLGECLYLSGVVLGGGWAHARRCRMAGLISWLEVRVDAAAVLNIR